MKITLRHLALFVGLLTSVSWLAKAADLPAGEGRDLLVQQCSGCHDLSMVLGDRHTEADWSHVVANMVDAGAELNDAQFTTLVKYLAKNLGPEDKKADEKKPEDKKPEQKNSDEKKPEDKK